MPLAWRCWPPSSGLGLGQIAPSIVSFRRSFTSSTHPKIVFLPVILVLGSGNPSKVLLIADSSFKSWLWCAMRQSLRPSSYVGALHRRWTARALPVRLPAGLAAGRADRAARQRGTAAVLIAETTPSSGLGYYIVVESWGALRYPEMYAGALPMSLLGLASISP
jgi:ABC-type nitrate/sulfonate/bicarbonate transport system permease component